ncbi:MAG: saccharopine dehydrogenase NADP-binding domain-containing protein [Deltaproteobacteria bacterium]|nr:saccharopine dehydrogenase NADP-binding domain-containing protein [Deltaproteobacteria bacterium]
MPSPDAAILVFGASGLVGRRVCRELAAVGVPFEIAGRREAALAEVAAEMPVTYTHVADARDPATLAAAFAGARVIINATGPLRDCAAPVLEAALIAGAHYVDVGGEQGALQALYERHESTARRAGLVALPGAGVDCTLGDLAAAWATAHLCGVTDDGPLVRTEPAPRLAEDRPLDEVIVSYVFDDLALSAGSQRALFGAAFGKPLVWRRDRWEAGRAGERRRVNAGPALGGERDAHGFAAGDVVTIPRHIAATYVATFLSTTRKTGTQAALRLLARALPFVPRAAGELLAPYAAPDTDYARTQFAVIAQVRRGFAAAQIVIRGRDLYRTTAAIAAWTAGQLATRTAGPSGMRAPAELFRAQPALRELSQIADLSIEPSFG